MLALIGTSLIEGRAIANACFEYMCRFWSLLVKIKFYQADADESSDEETIKQIDAVSDEPVEGKSTAATASTSASVKVAVKVNNKPY